MFKYPYGDSQQLNLDWIIQKIKELEENGGGGGTSDLTLEEVANALISLTYNSGTAYQRYDYCYLQGKLYRALANTSGTFDPSKWMEVRIGDDIPVLTRLINALDASLTTLQNTVDNLDSDDIENASSQVSGTTVTNALDNLKGAITSNPNIKFRSVGNSIMTGSVWVNGVADHLTEYNDSPYGIIAASLGIQQANVIHTMLSGSGMCSDTGNGTFYDYIVTNHLSLSGMDYLMTMLWTGDMYTLPMGTVNDTSSSNTIAGKVVGVCNYLRSSYPSVKLILLGVPCTNWAIAGNDVFTGAYSNGANIKQCDALMHTLAEKYHFTFVDWEQIFFATYYQGFTDGNNVHPNADKIYRLIGEYFADNIKGQLPTNDAFLKTLVLQSDTITGDFAGWRNIFSTDNPRIDEQMTIVEIVPSSSKDIKTVNLAWKVVNGNVQIYGNLSDTGSSFYITLARTNKINNRGVCHIASFVSASLITDTTISTSGEQTVNTYNNRKLSDYSLLYFALGSAAKTVYATAIIPTAQFTQSGYVLNLSGLAGANYDIASGAIIKYDSDTSIKVTLTGSKAFTHFQVTGTRIE